MDSSFDSQQIQYFYFVSNQLDRYLSVVIFVFGLIGNIFNCLIFTQKTFRSNSCAFLFLISSINSLTSLLFGLTTRFLSGWSIDPTSTIDWLCKGRTSIVFMSRNMALWTIMLASIDRWLSSSVEFHRRQISNMKNAKISVALVGCLSILTYIHMLYCYDANQSDEPLQCYGKTWMCNLITDIVYLLVTITIPLVFMIIFGLLTIFNVRRSQSRVQVFREVSRNTVSHLSQFKSKKTDRHLTRMLVMQIILLTIFCVPQGAQKFYLTINANALNSSFQKALNHLIYNIEILFTYTANVIPFYIYILASEGVFRKSFMELISRTFRRSSRS